MYLERFRLADRVAFVTGGARGIGLCTAEALAEAGARVTICDRDGAELDVATSALKAKGYEVASVVLEVTDADAVNAAADTLASREALSTCWSTTPASRPARSRRKRWRTSAG